MDMKEEMMNDAIDDAMGDEDDEEERPPVHRGQTLRDGWEESRADANLGRCRRRSGGETEQLEKRLRERRETGEGKIMMEFEKQSEIMDMKEEMMNDAIDDAMGDEDDEEERPPVHWGQTLRAGWEESRTDTNLGRCRRRSGGETEQLEKRLRERRETGEGVRELEGERD
ncbi:UNVERIFIED_CONTAM: hypothetical protein FKN15_033550 [Acipenser sinensis]